MSAPLVHPDAVEQTRLEIEANTEASFVLEKYVEDIYSGEHPGISKIVEKLRDKIKLCEGHLEYLAKMTKKETDSPP